MKNYSFFSTFFKKLYFIPALLFTALVSAVFFGALELGFLSTIFAVKKYFVATIIAGGVVALVICYLLIFNLSNKNVNLNDTLPFVALIFGVISLIFFLARFEVLTTKMVLAIVLPLVLGVLFLSLRVITFDKIADSKTESKCKVVTYVSKVFEKFPPLAVLFTTAIISCLGFLLLARTYKLNVNNGLLIVFAIPFVYYLITQTGSKKVSLFDAFIVALDLALVVLLAIVLAYKNHTAVLKRNLLILGAIAILAIFYTVVRIICFKPCDCCCCCKEIEAKTKFGLYAKTLNKKYNFALATAIGSVLAVVLLVLFRYGMFGYFFNKGNVRLSMVPFVALSATLYAVLVIGAIVSIINIKSKEVTIGDFMNVVCLTFLLFAIPASCIYNWFVVKALVFVATVVLGTVLSIRVKTIACANK